MFKFNQVRNQRRFNIFIGGNRPFEIGKSTLYEYRKLYKRVNHSSSSSNHESNHSSELSVNASSNQNILPDLPNSSTERISLLQNDYGEVEEVEGTNPINNVVANNHSLSNSQEDVSSCCIPILDPNANIEEINSEEPGLDVKEATIEDLLLALRTWQLDFALSNLGLTSLLQILTNPVYATLFIQLPKTSDRLIRTVMKQYKVAPDLCVECTQCEKLIRMKGLIITEIIGKGWFCKGRHEIYRLFKAKNFIPNYIKKFKKPECSNCSHTLDLTTIKTSSIFWLFSPLESYIKQLFNDLCSVANLLKPFDCALPPEIVSLLDMVRSNQWRTRDVFVSNVPDVANRLKKFLSDWNANPLLCKNIWERAKLLNIGDNLRNIKAIYDFSQCWHGILFWRHDVEARKSTPWNILLSLLFDWYAPNKTGNKSLAPLIVKILNLPRETVASRIDLYLYNLGYLPCDNEVESIRIQKYLKVFVEDFLEIREGNKVYNSLLDADCTFYISFGTVDADSVAAFQISCQQHPGRAKNNCRNCLGSGVNCSDCIGNRSYCTCWACAFLTKNNLKDKQYYVIHGGEIEMYRQGLNFHDHDPLDVRYANYNKTGLKALEKTYGILGYCVLNDIPEFNPATDVINEGLHLLFLNIVSAPVKIWVKSPVTEKERYFSPAIISEYKSILKRRLSWITYPRSISRKGLGLIEKPKRGIGEEWKNFILLVSLPLLRDVLKPDVYSHYRTLYEIIRIVLGDYIAEDDLEKLELKLNEFHHQQVSVYKTCKYALTTHSLQHLVNDIKNWSVIKCHWTCSLETIPKAERKLNVYTNGRNVNMAFSRICAERIAQHNLLAEKNVNRNDLRFYRDTRQSKCWPYFQSSDGRDVYLGKKCTRISLQELKQLICLNYDNSDFVLYDFINSIYTMIQRYAADTVDKLSNIKYDKWYGFLEEYYQLLHDNDSNIWDKWIHLLLTHDINISDIIIHKSIYLGYRKFYGIFNASSKDLYHGYTKYSYEGEWVRTNVNSESTFYGRLHRFIYLNFNFKNVLEQDLVIVQFYNWVREGDIDSKSGFPFSKFVNMANQNDSYFFPICTIQNKVCLQPVWENVGDVSPSANKCLIVPFHIWY